MTPALKPGWVVLTIGSNPQDLAVALDSIRMQSVQGPVVLVSNGTRDLSWRDHVSFEGVRVVELPHNIGIPAGRELGLSELPDGVDVALFLDDDARYLHEHVARDVLATMQAREDIAAVSLCIVDDKGNRQRRYVPRIGALDAAKSGEVTYFAGCAHALRRDAFLASGGYPSEFFYGHEESDLAWRLLDRGHTIWYDARKAVRHPHVRLERMSRERYGMLARNRVWMARRNLPTPLHAMYSLIWLGGAILQLPDKSAIGAYFRSWREAWRTPVDRVPISWSTVWRMTKLRRPPIL